MHVVELLRRVARRCHEDASRTGQAVEDGVVELVVALEILEVAFAKRDDTRLSNLLGIVEDVFEAERIDGIGVFLVFDGVDEFLVVARGVCHKTKLALESHPPIRTIVATTCGDACRMGSMRLDESIVAVSEGKEFILGGVFASDIEGAADGVGGYLVPQPLDAITRAGGVVEGGVCEVETNVDNAHHHAIARVGLGQCLSCIDGQRIDLHGCGVHQGVVGLTCLYTTDALVQRERRQTADGDIGNVDVAKTSQTATTVGLQHLLAIGRQLNEGTHMALTNSIPRPHLQSWSRLLADNHHAQTRRQLGEVGTLSTHLHRAHQQEQQQKQHARHVVVCFHIGLHNNDAK